MTVWERKKKASSWTSMMKEWKEKKGAVGGREGHSLHPVPNAPPGEHVASRWVLATSSRLMEAMN